jgi:hypothetical protein
VSSPSLFRRNCARYSRYRFFWARYATGSSPILSASVNLPPTLKPAGLVPTAVRVITPSEVAFVTNPEASSTWGALKVVMVVPAGAVGVTCGRAARPRAVALTANAWSDRLTVPFRYSWNWLSSFTSSPSISSR